MGRFPEAIEAERNLRLLDGEVPENVAREFADLNNNYSTHGSKAYWERELQLSKGPFWKARACAQLGQTDEAIAQLQLALKTRDVWLIFYVMTDWTLDPVRSKREFRDILRSMHFE